MTNFSRKQEQANTALVAVLAGFGVLALSLGLQGRQADLIEYCFKPSETAGFCTLDKRYAMPVSEWQTLKTEPASNPKSQIPIKATRLRIIKATNPHKWAWGAVASGLFGLAYTLSKARQCQLIRLLPQYRNEVKQSWLLTKIEAINTARKVEYAAEVDYQLWQFSTDRAGRHKQLSMLSPEEIAIFQQQAQLQAQSEVQERINAATGTPTAALPHGTPGTVEEQMRQGQFTEQSPVSSTSNAPSPSWIDLLLCTTALVWGNQGSGKSWFLRYLVQLKINRGYKIVVLDPNSNPYSWQGVAESHHTYENIEKFIQWYVDELTHRYSEFSSVAMGESEWSEKLWKNGEAITVICEEVTTWANMIDNKDLLSKFFRLALTQSRKQHMPCIFVAHNNTQTCLGNVTGLAQLIGKMPQLQLETTIDPITLKPRSSGKGLLKSEGQENWTPVQLPKLTEQITTFAPKPQTVVAEVEPKETIELKLSDDLGEPLKTIWLFAKEREDWVKPRDIQRKDYAVLKGKSSDNIRRYLGVLSDMGYGELDESDGSVRFKAF
jgi:hypothetical protein